MPRSEMAGRRPYRFARISVRRGTAMTSALSHTATRIRNWRNAVACRSTACSNARFQNECHCRKTRQWHRGTSRETALPSQRSQARRRILVTAPPATSAIDTSTMVPGSGTLLAANAPPPLLYNTTVGVIVPSPTSP
jgi:hypothetical protein